MLQTADLTIKLNPADDVVIACRDLEPGTNLLKEGVICKDRIPSGHKVATRAVALHRVSESGNFTLTTALPSLSVTTSGCQKTVERRADSSSFQSSSSSSPDWGSRAATRSRTCSNA